MKQFVEYTMTAHKDERFVRFVPADTNSLKSTVAGEENVWLVTEPLGGWPRPTQQGKCEKMLGVDLLPLSAGAGRRSTRF